MSKKGRQLRQYKKQLKQIQKLEKRLRQKGIKNSNKVDTIQEAKQYKRDLKRQLTDKQPKQSNGFKPSNKALREAIRGRLKKEYTPEQKPLPRQKPRQKIEQEKKVQSQKKKVQYEPQKQQKVRQDNVNKDTSFYAKAIISNYKNQLEQYPAMAEPMLKNWLDYMILSHGEEAVATMLQDGAENGIILSFEIAYSEEKLVGYIADLMDWLPEMTDWYKAELMEQFETWDDVL